MKVITNSPQETTKLGLTLAKKYQTGHLFALTGDLGGGKTCFTQGFARGLGIKKTINSPTFILMKVHRLKRGQLRYFCHVDAYRLHGQKEILEIGLHEYLGRRDTVVVIEWADRIKKLLAPYPKTMLHFSFLNKHKRLINITKTRQGRRA